MMIQSAMPQLHGKEACRSRFAPIASGMLAILLLLSVAPGPCAAAQDDYLKAIEAEGDELEFLGQAKKEQEALKRSAPAPTKAAPKTRTASPKKSAPAPGPAAKSTETDSQSEFEKSLNENFPGSFALYSVLDAGEKKAVFQEYLQADAEGTIRFLPVINKIIGLSSKRKTR